MLLINGDIQPQENILLEQPRVENKLDILFFTELFVSERKQIALMADENLTFSSLLRNKSLRNEDQYETNIKMFYVFYYNKYFKWLFV